MKPRAGQVGTVLDAKRSHLALSVAAYYSQLAVEGVVAVLAKTRARVRDEHCVCEVLSSHLCAQGCNTLLFRLRHRKSLEFAHGQSAA